MFCAAFFDVWLGIARFTFYVLHYSRADPPAALLDCGPWVPMPKRWRCTLKTRIYRRNTEYSGRSTPYNLSRGDHTGRTKNMIHGCFGLPPSLECIRALSHHNPWMLRQPVSCSDWLSQPWYWFCSSAITTIYRQKNWKRAKTQSPSKKWQFLISMPDTPYSGEYFDPVLNEWLKRGWLN